MKETKRIVPVAEDGGEKRGGAEPDCTRSSINAMGDVEINPGCIRDDAGNGGWAASEAMEAIGEGDDCQFFDGMASSERSGEGGPVLGKTDNGSIPSHAQSRNTTSHKMTGRGVILLVLVGAGVVVSLLALVARPSEDVEEQAEGVMVSVAQSGSNGLRNRLFTEEERQAMQEKQNELDAQEQASRQPQRSRRRTARPASSGGASPAADRAPESPGFARMTSSIEMSERSGDLDSFASRVGGRSNLPSTLTQTQIMNVIRPRRRAIQSCFERQLRREGGLGSQRATIRFEIQPSGVPTDISVGDVGASTLFATCVSQQVSNWRFPPFRGAGVPVEYPVVLTATD